MSVVGPRPENYKKRIMGVPGSRRFTYLWKSGKRTGKVYTEEEWNAFLDSRVERRKNRNPSTFVRDKFSKQKGSARTRNIEWALNINTVTGDILEQDCCALCGRRFVYKAGHIDSPSIDRIDSNRGYTPDNVQYVTSRVNIMKGPLTTEEFNALNKNIYNTALLDEYRRLYND